MSYLTVGQINDLNRAQDIYKGQGKLSLIATELTRFEIYEAMLRPGNVERPPASPFIQFQIMNEIPDQASGSSLYDEDDVNIQSFLTFGQVGWSHYKTGTAWDRRELLLNGASRERILDLKKLKIAASTLSLIKLLEQHFWEAPSGSSEDERHCYGVDYWITQGVASDNGFTGPNHANYSGGPAGVDRTTEANWKNWFSDFSNVDKGDLIKKMRRAHTSTEFISPVDLNEYSSGAGRMCRGYTGLENILELEDLQEGQNENLGADLSKFGNGDIVFRRNLIRYIPQIDTSFSSTRDLFFLNLDDLKVCSVPGNWFVEMTHPAPLSHNQVVTWTDLTMQLICRNPRLHSRFAQV